MDLSIVVAMSRNRVIGRGGGLPWRLPADLKRFKALTLGKPVLMGRRTFESIGKALPGRTNLVLTGDRAFRAEGCTVVHGIAEALERAAAAEEVMVIGGAAVYRECLPRARRLYLTRVEAEVEGDTFFPPFDAAEWVEVSREERPADERNPYAMTFLVLERSAAP